MKIEHSLPAPTHRESVGDMSVQRPVKTDTATARLINRVLGWIDRSRMVILPSLMLLMAIVLFAGGQVLAMLVLLPLGLLLWDWLRIRKWIGCIASRIERRQPLEKLEVDQGPQGALSRAINGLMQEQSTLRHTASFQPVSMPAGAMGMLHGEGLPHSGWEREVVVLVVGRSSNNQTMNLGQVDAWQALVRLARIQSERYEALLLPCGAGMQLIFGAFDERPLAESLRGALSAARTVAQEYQRLHGEKLVAGLASSSAVAMVIPGLGYSVLGPAIEQALSFQQLAVSRGDGLLLCGERDFLRLSQRSATIARRMVATPLPAEYSIYSLPLDTAIER